MAENRVRERWRWLAAVEGFVRWSSMKEWVGLRRAEEKEQMFQC
jgi:hypothetical protein